MVGPDGNVIHQAGTGHEIIPVEIDFAAVRRSRRRGLLGLGQVLKSFRDTAVEFPPYRAGPAGSAALASLGPLQCAWPRAGRDLNGWIHAQC